MLNLKKTLIIFSVIFTFQVHAQTSGDRAVVDQAKARMNWLLASTADTGEDADYLMAIYCYTGKFVFEEKRGLNQLSEFI